MRRVSIEITLAVSAALVAGIAPAATVGAQEGERSFSLQVFEQIAHDDNLYRLPDDIDLGETVLGPEASRDDRILRTSVAAKGRWTLARQAFDLSATVEDYRFSHNEGLDNVSGQGRANWLWQLGGRWSGKLGADYTRALAGFANSRFLERDLFETEGYHALAQYRLTSRWTLSAQGRRASASHDNVARRIDDFDSRSGTFGVEYRSRAGNVIGWEYRLTEATFPNQVSSESAIFDRNYDERMASVRLQYALSAKTALQASAGNVKRDHARGSIGDFSGNVWTAALQWQPRQQWQLEANGWRQLRAHLDAESDHFVSRGVGLQGAWSPTRQLTFTIELSSEDQDYIGGEQSIDPLESARSDELRAGTATVSYVSTRGFLLNLSYRLEQRESNRPLFDYDAKAISFGFGIER